MWSEQKSSEGRSSEHNKDDFSVGVRVPSTAAVYNESDLSDSVQEACFAEGDTVMEYCEDFSPNYGCAGNVLAPLADDGEKSPSTGVRLKINQRIVKLTSLC